MVGAKRARQGLPATHSLIAFGRGEWFGVGLGGSVEKLYYLPEAHTDFILAVLGEELGLVGVMSVVVLFYWLVKRAFEIGRQAIALERTFAGLVAQGIGLWLGVQAFINMGVAMGLLPTKGLTLPLMSYGGSALLSTCVALAHGAARRLRESHPDARGTAYEPHEPPDGGRGRHRRARDAGTRGRGSAAGARLDGVLARHGDRHGARSGRAARRAVRRRRTSSGCAARA